MSRATAFSLAHRLAEPAPCTRHRVTQRAHALLGPVPPPAGTQHAPDIQDQPHCSNDTLLGGLLLAVEALLRHTQCPAPRWQPRTMHEWLT